MYFAAGIHDWVQFRYDNKILHSYNPTYLARKYHEIKKAFIKQPAKFYTISTRIKKKKKNEFEITLKGIIIRLFN